MKPPPFAYHAPASLEEALDLLGELGDGAAVLAGGQSLIPLLNLRLAAPDAVVDLRRIGCHAIVVGPDGAQIGAMARASVVERDEEVGVAAPSLVEALHEVGHPQIRNRTTIGGSVAHADPAAELPTVLVALDGAITLRSAARGERTVPATEFFDGVFSTIREPDELVTSVWFPRFDGPSTFLELARRPGDFALVGACLALSVAGGVVRDVRIGLSGVADRPVRARDAEDLLRGEQVSSARLAEAAAATSSGLRPGSDVHASGAYRAAVAGVLVQRGLARLVGTVAR